MIDQKLREAKDRAIDPVVRVLVARRVGPGWFTAAGLITSLAAGALAWRGLTWWALVAFLAGRVFDSVDGAVARHAGTASDLGGYLDQLADTIGYALVPLGLAAGAGTTAVWAGCAVLLASFYVNIVSWAYLSALAEKRGAGVAVQGTLDPMLLFAPREVLAARVARVVEQAGSAPGHIFNLGHGITPETSVDAVKFVADHVHALTAR